MFVSRHTSERGKQSVTWDSLPGTSTGSEPHATGNEGDTKVETVFRFPEVECREAVERHKLDPDSGWQDDANPLPLTTAFGKGLRWDRKTGRDHECKGQEGRWDDGDGGKDDVHKDKGR